MRDYNKIDPCSYVDVDDIARALRDASNAPSHIIGELIDAVYYLKACAQNEYNKDYFRILYNVLEDIAEKA